MLLLPISGVRGSQPSIGKNVSRASDQSQSRKDEKEDTEAGMGPLKKYLCMSVLILNKSGLVDSSGAAGIEPTISWS